MKRLMIVFAALSSLAADAPKLKPRPLLFRDTRIFDGARVLKGDVLVEDGLIRAVGPKLSAKNAEVIDGHGKTLLPGLIDAHTHAYEDKALKQALVLGVTTELEMFGDPAKNAELRKREVNREDTGQADLRSSGILATAPNGHGTEYGIAIPTLTRPDEAQAFVDARIADGSDYIKVVLDDGKWFSPKGIPTLDRATLAAIIEAAHRRHKMAIVHIGAQDGARAAIEAGADGLAHLFLDRAPDADFAKLIADHRAFVIPTMAVLFQACTGHGSASLGDDPALAPFLDESDKLQLSRTFRFALPAANAEYLMATVKQLKAANVPLLAGTDALNPGVVHGASLHRELELLVSAGLTPLEALASATSVPASKFHLADRGRVAPGLRADLVLVDGDPTSDVRQTRAIVGVWKRGVRVDREGYRAEVAKRSAEIVSERAAPAPAGSESGVIATFEDGKTSARFGSGWSSSTDAMRGGTSTVDLKVVNGGARNSKGALLVTGEIKGGSTFAWAGAMFSPGSTPMAPANLSAKKTLTFFAKGDGKKYRVMLFARHLGFVPSTRTFTAGPDWKQISIALADFDGADGRDVMGLLWTGGPDVGRFAFSIDEIELH